MIARLWNHPRKHIQTIVRLGTVCPLLFGLYILLYLHWFAEPLTVALVRIFHNFGIPVGIAIGFALINAGRPRREGDEKHCVRCDYQAPPTGERPRRCPECFMDWSVSDGLVRGRRVVHPKLIWAGLLVCAFSLALFAKLLSYRTLGCELASTDSLIQCVARAPTYIDPSVFVVVFARSMSAEQERRLAVAVLDARLRGVSVTFPKTPDWLTCYTRSGRAPDVICRRYFEEAFPMKLAVDRITAGRESEGSVDGEPRKFWSGDCLSLLVDRVYVDGEEFRAARMSPLVESGFVHTRFKLPAMTAGTHSLRLSAIAVAHAPPATARPIQRNASGEPIIPPWALSWRQLNFERTVTVERD